MSDNQGLMKDGLGRPISQEEQAKVAEMIQHARKGMKRHTRELLRRGDAAKAGENLMANTERAIAGSPGQGMWQCTKGCPYCCDLGVSIAVPEAIFIAKMLRDNLPANELAEIHAIIRANAARARGKERDPYAYIKAKIPCAFLTEDRQCGIYDMRPTTCRGYASFDRASCKAFLEDPEGRSVTVDMAAWLVSGSLMKGLQDAIVQAHLDGELYELHNAMAVAIEPGAEEAWLAGKSPFKGCHSLEDA